MPCLDRPRPAQQRTGPLISIAAALQQHGDVLASERDRMAGSAIVDRAQRVLILILRKPRDQFAGDQRRVAERHHHPVGSAHGAQAVAR